jgi:DMSO/TMAO reductase YedYZ heme-binding membrane subunit
MSGEWILIRGSGIVAFALLSAAVIWGLLVSSKLLGRLVKAKPLTWFHESLGIGALVATVVHVFVISIHEFLEFSWAEILVPGLSDWETTAVGFGTAAFYGLVVVSLSFYFKKRIGQKAWRSIHYGSFGVFVASLVHGIQAGSDTSHPMMIGLYAGSVVVVMGLLANRLLPRPDPTKRRGRHIDRETGLRGISR